jgi:hypothetical protein
MTSLATQILRASEGILYQSINRFQLEWAGAAATGAVAALARSQISSPYFSRTLTLNQIFMGVVNAGWLLWDCAVLSKALHQKQISASVQAALMLAPLAGSLKLHFKWSHERQNPPHAPFSAQLSTARAAFSYVPWDAQSWAQALILTRVIMNLAITWLSPQCCYWAGLNVIGLGYSYLKNAQIKWLKFSCTLDYPPVAPAMHDLDKSCPKELRCDYEFPLFPNQDQRAQCVSCLEEDPPFSLCPPHNRFHLDCWADSLYAALKKCQDKFTLSFARERYDTFLPRAIYLNYRAHLKAPEADFPDCHECHNRSDLHTLNVQYFDQVESRGDFATTLEWVRDPHAAPANLANRDSLWACLGTIGSVAHAALATMQERHPDIAGKIATARGYFILFDLGAIAHHYWQLYKLLYEKYVVIKARRDTPQERVTRAADELEAARLAHANLNTDIDAAIAARTILKIHKGVWIPLSKQGDAILQKIKEALETQEITISEASPGHLTSQTPAGKSLIQDFAQAHSSGEITHIGRCIPLSSRAIPVLQNFSTRMERKEIVQVDGFNYGCRSEEAIEACKAFNEMCKNYEIAQFERGLLPLSPAGKRKLDQYSAALSSGAIVHTAEEVQCRDEASKVIWDEFLQAISDFEIFALGQGRDLIPITPEARELLKQCVPFAQRLGAALNEDERAKQEAADRRVLIQKEYHRRLKVGMVVGGVALAAISAVAVHTFHKKFPMVVDLTEVLKKVALPEDVKNMKISGDVTPFWEPQCLILHRIFLNVVLMFFSPDKRTYALSAFAQAVVLWQGPSRELVVQLQRTHAYSIADVTASFKIRVPFLPLAGCSSLSSHLECHTKAIYDYTTKLLQGSSWERYFGFYRSFDPLTTTYQYKLDPILKSGPLASCACKLAGIVESTIIRR